MDFRNYWNRTCSSSFKFFYFCQNAGLALPLIVFNGHEVKLKFNWGLSTTVGTTATCEVSFDYIYLDTDERRRFAQVL